MLKVKKLSKISSFSCIAILFILNISTNAFSESQGKKLYTAYNIWYETGKESSLWCINYKTGNIIPAGTEVMDVSLARPVSGRFQGGSKQAIAFTAVNDGKKFYVNFKAKFHPGKTIEDYMELMLTGKNFTQITKGLNEKEIKAIREGVIRVGMSKRAVYISYGPPPEHKTSSQKNNAWTYWMNRFKSKRINFDKNNRATATPQHDPNIL